MKKKFEPAYRLNLQFFAEGEGGTDEGGTSESGAETTETAKALTAEDIQKMIQSEVDKVRTKSAKELKAAEEKVKALQNEKLTEQEKFELAQQELAEKTKTLQERENIIFAKDALVAAELDPSFLDFVRAGDEEGTTAKVQALKTSYDKAVAAGIEAHIKSTGRSFTKGSGPTESSMASSIAEQMNKQQTPANNGW